LKDLSGGNGENGSLGEPIGLIGPSVDGLAFLDGFRPLVANARRVYHAQRQLANAYGFQQIGRICLNGIGLLRFDDNKKQEK
jgi:hypothetical protein